MFLLIRVSPMRILKPPATIRITRSGRVLTSNIVLYRLVDWSGIIFPRKSETKWRGFASVRTAARPSSDCPGPSRILLPRMCAFLLDEGQSQYR